MTGTALPAAGYFSGGGRLNSEAKTAQDDTLAFLRQSVLGTATIGTLTIASGAITPTKAVQAVDTESAAATDDLTNILTTNMVDGQLLVLTGVSSARITTIKHASGGSGQIFLQDDTEYALDDENTIVLRLNGSDWYEVSRNNGAQYEFFCGTAAGTANALTATTNINIPALKTGMIFNTIASLANTSGTVTAAINGFSAKTIKQNINAGGKVLVGIGSIAIGTPLKLLYDGTDLVWLNRPTYQHGADIASASTLNLNNATGDLVDVTGTTTITAITLTEGSQVTCRFTGALTLTNGASLVLPGGANITTAAGDIFTFRGYASGVVRVVNYSLISGAAVSGTSKFVQMKRYSSGAVTTGITAVIPYDDTIPQNTEGVEWGTLAITPTNTSNRLLIEVNLNYSVGTGVQVIAALFQDSTANALAVVNHNTNGNTAGGVLRLSHEMAAGTTSATTFKVRVGTYSGGTLVINGAAGARLFGGVYISSITITEMVP